MGVDLLGEFNVLNWFNVLQRRTLAHTNLDQRDLLLIWVVTAVAVVTRNSFPTGSNG